MAEDTVPGATGVVADEPVPADGTGANAQPRHRQVAGSEALPTTSRVLSRIARFGSGRGSSTSPLLDPLLRTVRVTHPKADLSVIERAFDAAARAHAGQKRKSGDPYITHPVAVASILAELGMTPPTLAAALLHDTVEDTDYTLDALRKDFGDEVAMLVDGVTKLDKVSLRRRRAGRDRPQDGRRDVPRHPGPGHQARRPAAQRPHLALRAAGLGRAQGPRDAGDLRPAGPSPRHEHDQVGARGPLVRDPVPQGLRRDRAPGRRAGTGPRGVPRRRCASRSAPTCGPPRSRRRSPAGRSTTTRSTRR